jgi:hypothetical protein
MRGADEWVHALKNKGKKVEKKAGGGYMAQCPAHDDGRPSLSIDQDGERVLAHCFAGCGFDQIREALDIEPDSSGLLLDQLAASRLRDYVQTLGHQDINYVYVDADGAPLYRVTRTPDKRFFQSHFDYDNETWEKGRGGVPGVPYRLPDVVRAREAGEIIYVAEGEKDVEALVRAGVVATCNAGGAGKWDATWAPMFAGADVVVISDNDEPGQSHAADVAAKLSEFAGSLRIVKPKHGKDAFDHLTAGYAIEALIHVWPEEKEPERDILEDFRFEAIDPDAPPPPKPTIMDITDRSGAVTGHLFSCGGKYLLTGAQASGKTFLCLALAVSMMRDGHKVLWADPDGSGQGRIAARMVEQFGVDKDTLRSSFMYARAQLAYTTDLAVYREHMREQVRRYMPSLVVWDSWGPALAALGLDGTTSDSDINSWWQTFVEPVFAENPNAMVVVLDHIPKNDQNNSIKGVYGNQRKLSAPDYALTMKPEANTSGAFYVDILKDRDAVWEEWGSHGLSFQIVGDGTWTLMPTATDDEKNTRKENDRAIALLSVLKKQNDVGNYPTKNKWWASYKLDREERGHEVGRKADVLEVMNMVAGVGCVAVNGDASGYPTYKWIAPFVPGNVSQ